MNSWYNVFIAVVKLLINSVANCIPWHDKSCIQTYLKLINWMCERPLLIILSNKSIEIVYL